MKNLRLDLKNGDGSPYWTAHFNDQESLDLWLAEEKTRPYWRNDLTSEVIDLTPPPPTAEELAAIAAEKDADRQIRQLLKQLKKSDMVTVADCADAIIKILKLLKADK